MRLRRIEAVSYGALRNVTLGDLGDRLTVVHGPNEAGKSTLISLVRHVLYGYPTARDKEPGYAVSDAKRLGRLVFEDAEGSWVVERTEGTHGGDVRVRALAGPSRPDLLEMLTRGVSAHGYRVVFGFGLDEMPAIEESRGTGDDVIGRLYSASAGLRVSPHQVRATIEADREGLFKPGGRKPEINALVAEVRGVRSDLRELARRAEALAEDQEHLRALGENLIVARASRDAARTRAGALAVATDRADERLRTIADQDEVLLELRRQRKRVTDELAAVAPDAPLLAAAPEIDAVLADAAGFGASVTSLADAESALARAQTRASDAAKRAGFEPEALAGLGDPRELSSAAEQARDDLQRLDAMRESRVEQHATAESALAKTQAAAARALDPLGIPLQGADEVVADRLAALDALDALRARGAGRASSALGGIDVPSLVLFVSGLAAAIAGFVLGEPLTGVIGAVLAIVGAFFVYRSRYGAPALPSGDERGYLTLLGLEAGAGTLELSRMRRALDAALGLLSSLAEAEEVAQEAAASAELARDAFAARQAAWVTWLEASGLAPSLSPAGAVGVLGLVADARAAAVSVAEAADDVRRVTARLDAFAARLSAIAAPFVDTPDVASRIDVPVIANRLSEALAAARGQVARREDLEHELASLEARIETEEARATRARDELREVLERFDLAETGTHDDLRVLRAEAEHDLGEVERAFEDLAEERSQLHARLEEDVRERKGSELRLAEAGISERIADAVDRYLVLAVASRLLADAQERYERERQPEVVKHAERIFTTITGGRYETLSVPLGSGRVEVFDDRAEAKTSDRLSRGAAEQLYLALRLGLIARLDEVGCGLPVLMDDVLVNFDPARRRGATEAVAELAGSRQVVFFTCHPETAELFAEVAPDHIRLEL